MCILGKYQTIWKLGDQIRRIKTGETKIVRQDRGQKLHLNEIFWKQQSISLEVITCNAMTDWRKAVILATAFTQIGPLTLFSKKVCVEDPYAQYPAKVTRYNGRTPTVNWKYRAFIMFLTTGCRIVAY
jgi:hypothetical protein